MSLWIQQGYGKSDKIERLAAEGVARGLVASPADEDRNALQDTVRRAQELGLEVLLDPQTYVGSITGGTARCHESHGLGFDRVHWGTNPTEIAAQVSAVIDAHHALGLERICSPTCVQRGFNDAWTTLAIQYARATVDLIPNSYVSVVFEEAALNDWQRVEDWLDVVTTLDSIGFYLIVVRSATDYPQPWDPTRLSNLLRMVYRLGVLNRYEVVLGYSDMEGLLAQVAGATGFASGWFYTLRAFTELKWQPSSGGRAAKPRVTSAPLLSSFRVEGEADLLARSPIGVRVFPDVDTRERIVPSAPDWSLPDSWHQHLVSVGNLANDLEAQGTLRARRRRLWELLDAGSILFEEARDEALPLPAHYQTRLRVFRTALAEFEARESPA